MFGYACDETKELMPLPITLAHKLTKKLAEVRKNGTLPFLRPDGKAQVAVKYIGGRAVGIDNIVISAQHDENITLNILRDSTLTEVIEAVIPQELLKDEDKGFILIPTGEVGIWRPTRLMLDFRWKKGFLWIVWWKLAHIGEAHPPGKDPTKIG